jgi:hypothetical protein
LFIGKEFIDSLDGIQSHFLTESQIWKLSKDKLFRQEDVSSSSKGKQKVGQMTFLTTKNLILPEMSDLFKLKKMLKNDEVLYKII